MNIAKVPKAKNPVLIDSVIAEIQDQLKDNLEWLDYSFGRSQKLVTTKEKQNYFYPGVHIGSGAYLNVLPDQQLGNYSFFVLDDPQRVQFAPNTANNIKVNFSMIFWFNLNKVYPGLKDRNTEAIKAEVLAFITRKMFLKTGRITIEKIYENPENVYKGFSLKEVDSQYMMQPYGGIRFEGQLIFMEGGC